MEKVCFNLTKIFTKNAQKTTVRIFCLKIWEKLEGKKWKKKA